MEDRRLRCEGADQRVVGVGDADAGEADLSPPSRLHLGAQGAGQELRPQADAEHGDLPVDRFGEQLALRLEPRVGLEMSGAHRPAHRDDAVELIEGRQRVACQGFDLEQPGAGCEGIADPVRALPGRVY